MALVHYPWPATGLQFQGWQRMWRVANASGVVAGELGELEVTAPGTGMVVDVAPGWAFSRGVILESSDTETIVIPDNLSGSPRIDVLVVEFDRANTTAQFKVIEGTPAGVPQLPTLTATDALFHVPLAAVTVGNGATVITPGEVEDVRAFAGRASTRTATVATAEATSSTSYSDLATAGPSVTAWLTAGQRALIIPGCRISVAPGLMSWSVQGAGSQAASDAWACGGPAGFSGSRLGEYVAQASGLYRFLARYRSLGGGDPSFDLRSLTVMPL